MLAPSKWLLYTDPTSYTSRYEITFELIKDLGPSQKWLPVAKKPKPSAGNGSGAFSGSKPAKSGPGKPPSQAPNPTPPTNKEGAPKTKEKGVSIQEPQSLAPKNHHRYYEGTGKAPVIVRNEESDSEEEDLSWFYTGGGKTEADMGFLSKGGESSKPQISDLAPSDLDMIPSLQPQPSLSVSVHTASDSISLPPPSSPLPDGVVLQEITPASAPSPEIPNLPDTVHPLPVPDLPAQEVPASPVAIFSSPILPVPPPQNHESSDQDDSIQIISAPSASAAVVNIPSHSPPDNHTGEEDTAQSPHLESFIPDLSGSDIDPSKLSSFTVTVNGADSLPEIHTQGDPGTAAKVFTLLLNQLVAPALAQPPSPQPPPTTNSNPNTPTLAAETPPSRKRTFRMDSIRRSVRVRAQRGEGISMLNKAQAVAQKRYNLRSGGKGNALIHNHPYSRLTVKEISALFRAYHIQLGINELRTCQIIQAIKTLGRSDFDRMITQALDTLKSKDDSFCLVLDLDSDGGLTFQ